MNLLTLQRLKCDFYELKTWCLSGRASGTKSRTEPLAFHSSAVWGQLECRWAANGLTAVHSHLHRSAATLHTHTQSLLCHRHTHTQRPYHRHRPPSKHFTRLTHSLFFLLTLTTAVQSKVILSFQPGYEASAAIVRLSGPRGFTHPPCYSPTSAGWTITDGDVRSVRCRRERVLHTATLI